jgi:hypothetical protein
MHIAGGRIQGTTQLRRMLLDLHAPRLYRYLAEISKYKKARPAEKFPLVAVGTMIPMLLIGQA